jgi:hypothetical protein
MATDSDIDELKRMCLVLFLELREVRRRLDIDSFELRDDADARLNIERDLRDFQKLLAMANRDPRPSAVR